MPNYIFGAYSNRNEKNKAKTNHKPRVLKTKAKKDHSLSKAQATSEDKLIQVDQVKMEGNVLNSPLKDTKPMMTDMSPEPMTIHLVDSPVQIDSNEAAKLLSADEQFKVSTSIFLTSKQSIFSNESGILKGVVENYMAQSSKQTGEILFSFCVFTSTQIHDLLNLNQNKVAEHANYRQVFSVEHILDLIRLGKLNEKSRQNQEWFMRGPFSVCHFYGKANSADASKHFFLIEGNFTQEDSLVAALSTIQEIEACVRARQRNVSSAPIVNGNSLANLLEPAFTADKSKMTLMFHFPELSACEQLIIDSFGRMKEYGTDEDDYGDNIIEMNKELIKIQHPDKESVYLYLLNNVSLLEHDLLEAHKHYNEATHNWLSNHQNLRLMLNSTQMIDVKQYTSQLLDLLADQQKQIGNLKKSVCRFCTGLEQLQLSVEYNADG